MTVPKRFQSFTEFYPFYLSEHGHPVSRRLHIVGTTVALLLMLASLLLRYPMLLLVALIQGYAFAWIGHFFFEHNRPATFQYPLWSLMGDWRLWWETMMGKRRF